MQITLKQELKIMPKIRCPKCEKSNMSFTDNDLYCPECHFRLHLFGSHTKPTPNS
jgi:Zn finger protein HypA/HybF involved in hydrogenase expression